MLSNWLLSTSVCVGADIEHKKRRSNETNLGRVGTISPGAALLMVSLSVTENFVLTTVKETYCMLFLYSFFPLRRFVIVLGTLNDHVTQCRQRSVRKMEEGNVVMCLTLYPHIWLKSKTKNLAKNKMILGQFLGDPANRYYILS